MKVLILTSKDHLYANVVLNKLIRSGILGDHIVIVFEQDWIIPNKNKFAALFRYFKIAGRYYVISQIIKQYIFLTLRCLNTKKNNKESPFYPYYINDLRYFYRRAFKGFNSKNAFEYIKEINPDLIISIFSKEIIPEEILKIPKYGCVNLHPALLPFYKGISPTFWVLANNEFRTGITLHYMDSGIDTGPIISQKEIIIKGFKTEHSIYIYI